MVGMGLSTQQIYVNVRVWSFAAYLIKADAPVCLLFLQPVGRSPMSAKGPGRVKTFSIFQKLHAAGRDPRRRDHLSIFWLYRIWSQSGHTLGPR